ncbi:hypothetical protein GGI35DRAFT_454555 [Trichoderma velutinum]
MDTQSANTYKCLIICDVEIERKEIINKLKSFKGYKILEEKYDWFITALTKPDNEDMAFVKSDDGEMVPQAYMNLHQYLIGHGFMITFQSLDLRHYKMV